ncbi:DUF3962 domain-containing protein [Amycolatopsis sp. NPDC089917]|uniref:pPIWI_RE module domain-containing protein n=1 Tax=Amycolatopsis sp. NPDC089917 TaxID=3155187 RepID=UPI0034134501
MHSLIRLCAYEPDDNAWVENFHVLTFSEQWREELTDLHALGWRGREPFVGLPIRRFGSLLRAVAPGVVATGRGAVADPSVPWIYAKEELPAEVILPAFLSWITDLRPEAEHQEALVRVLDAVRTTRMEWVDCPVELTGAASSAGGTSAPERRLYHLLPELLALRLAAKPFKGESRFRVVSQDQGAELVSWPPERYRDGGVEHRYSVRIGISMHTVPFASKFRIHMSYGIRRWSTSAPVWLPSGRGASVLLDAPFPWDEDKQQVRSRLVHNSIRYESWTGRHVWHRRSSIGIIKDLDLVRQYPEPKEIVAAPQTWIDGPELAAGVVHSTAMGKHMVGPGLMPGERAMLDEWVAEGMAPHFRRVPDLVRAARAAKPVLLPKANKKDPVRSAQVRGDAAAARRAALRAACDGEPLRVDVVTLYPETRKSLVRQFAYLLGLDSAGGNSGEVLRWSIDGLDVELHLSDAGSMCNALSVDSDDPAAVDKAIRFRRAAVAAQFSRRTGVPGLALIEIPRATRFQVPGTDPKGALRLGFADTRRLTQFIQVADHKTADVDVRAAAAWTDGFRQLGASTVPVHRAGSAVEPDVQYVALWAVRRNRRDQGAWAGCRLVAVRIRPNDTHLPVCGWSDEQQAWVPYPELLLSLASVSRDSEDRGAEIQSRIRTILFGCRDRPTLLLVNSPNLRDSWPSLGNQQLVEGHLSFTGLPNQRLAAFGPRLRVVLIRDRNNREEVPQWYAPAERTPGFASGLWKPKGAGQENRVFASTADVPSSSPKIARNLRKFERSDEWPARPTTTAWNPQCLELTVLGGSNPDEDPVPWAALTHQLRFHDDYAPLARPLPMHLAKKADEYFGPVEEDREEE